MVTTRFRRLMFAVATLFLAVSAPFATAADDPAMRPAALTDEQKIVHVLNRLGFGPRPGDVERVKRIGLDRYVRQQLDAKSVDDSAAEKAIAHLDTLKMDSGHFVGQFYDDIKFFIQMQMAAGNTEDMKMRFGLELSKQAGAAGGAPAAGGDPPAGAENEKPTADKPTRGYLTAAGMPNLSELANRDSIRFINELQHAKLMRAVLSERQLDEVMADFWSNHFNIDVRKNACRALLAAHDRDVIRPHALGKFRDLLGAVAHSPAMLAYLDNNENSVARQRSKVEQRLIEWFVGHKLGMRGALQIPDREGPNENYGRELLELHTLGVDGGYTQQDVQEVARCFSGWTYTPLGGKFDFNKHRHDQGPKVVLGQAIPANGGVKDGERVLDLLARHPSTARFISRKLCQRFVADDPPAALVDRAAQVFADTDGDVRKVVEAIVTSDEFFAPAAARAKIKSPFEYAASAVRATGGTFASRGWGMFGKLSFVAEGGALLGNDPKLSKAKRKTLTRHVHDMGQPLFAHAAPTGYPERSAKWVSPGALIDRLNFAVALTQADVSDVKVDVRTALGKGVSVNDPEAVVDRVAATILHQPLNPATKRTLLKTLNPEGDAKKAIDVNRAAALILGSPEFQRR